MLPDVTVIALAPHWLESDSQKLCLMIPSMILSIEKQDSPYLEVMMRPMGCGIVKSTFGPSSSEDGNHLVHLKGTYPLIIGTVWLLISSDDFTFSARGAPAM